MTTLIEELLMQYSIRLFLLIITLSTGTLTHALPSEGSCVGYRFPGENSNAPDVVTPIDSSVILRTLRQDVPVFKDKHNYFSGIKLLNFDVDVKPVKQTSQRIQVIKGYQGQPLGWIEKLDLLCQGSGADANMGPLKMKGLPHKVFLKYRHGSQVPN